MVAANVALVVTVGGELSSAAAAGDLSWRCRGGLRRILQVGRPESRKRTGKSSKTARPSSCRQTRSVVALVATAVREILIAVWPRATRPRLKLCAWGRL